MRRLILFILCLHIFNSTWAQPEPCGVDAMTSTCLDACVVCDIDGFTGTNNLTIQGQTFPNFCTTIFHNMSYIAFIAGTENLTLSVTVTNCTINRGLEIGIFESADCETFTAMTDCNTDVAPNATATFSNLAPLVVGQHYYLIMDGSMGDICDWTFNVIEGSTLVGDLTTSGIIEGQEELCPELSTTYSTTGEVGATLFYWTVNGIAQNGVAPEIDIAFPADGTYELCVTAANVCDEAPPSCTTINVVSPAPLFLMETLCANDCIEVAGETVCESGLYEYLLPLPNGCDSAIFLDLIVLPEIETFLDINLCIGETFSIGTSSFSSTGIFVETIQNQNGCDSTVTLDLMMIECEINGTMNFTTPICHGDENGTLLFSLQNGTPPFYYNWNNITTPTIGGTGSTNLFTDILIENIPAGIYEINVVDNFDDDIVFIQEVIDPPVLTLTINATDYNGSNLTCYQANDGIASAIANGGVPPYSFLWSNGETETSVNNLAAGFYEVEVTDANGCTNIVSTVLYEPESLEFITNYIDPNCDGIETGIVQLDSIWGGTQPYSFTLNEGQYNPIGTFENLGPGNYDYSVLDANGCFADTSSSLFVPDIPILFMDEDKEIDLGCNILISAATNNTSLIDISWTNIENSLECDSCLSTISTPVNDTEYILTVTSIDGCSTSDSIFVKVNKIRDVFIPNAFSPNGDGYNDSFFINANKSVSLIKTFKVFNRWGALVYEGTDLSPNQATSGWDGTFKGKLMNSGVYVWMAEIEYLDGETLLMKGDVTIVL
ncbi:MAG: gliding motility-associated C-terminal domain-containing protein [Saprospiraceae bacterium]